MKWFKPSAWVPLIAILFAACWQNEKAKEVTFLAAPKVDPNLGIDSIHICTEYVADVEAVGDTAKIQTFQFYDQALIMDTIEEYQAAQPERVTSSIVDKLHWETMDLTVSFTDGDPEVQKRVMASARKWEQVCGIRFSFGDFPHPDISISFRERGSGSWIGTLSRNNNPSMNLGWLNRNTDDEEIDRVVLHEFGHALGLIHEHERPDAPIVWDTAKVVAFYKLPPNKWTDKDIYWQIFHKYAAATLNSTVFDPQSIMIYEIRESITKNHFHTAANSKLSPLDIQLVNHYYPSRNGAAKPD